MLLRAVMVSHTLAAIAFLALALALLWHWRSRRHAAGLAAACAGSAVWGICSAAGVAQHPSETLRSALWLMLLVLLRGSIGRASLRALLIIASVSVITLSPAAPMAVILARLVLAMYGLLLVEQLYRHAAPSDRWSIKFGCMAIGAMFAYDFYLYSDAALFHAINPDIAAARGMANALTVPLLCIAVARDPRWAATVLPSRSVILHSATLVGAALYLLAMAGSGYYLRLVGGAWGPLMQLVFFFGACVVLGGILFSGTVRAALKVRITKHFFAEGFDYRREWMDLTRALSRPGDDLPERTIQAIASLVESPSGRLWLRHGDTLQPAAAWNASPGSDTFQVSDALWQFLQRRQWILEVADCAAAPQRYGVSAVPPALTDSWLVLPLILHGELSGLITLAAPRARIVFNWEVRDMLKIAGSQAASYLAYRASLEALLVARQFESFNRMSAFIVHDLKNMVCQFSLLLANAERHRHNPVFQADMISTLELSVAKMQALLQRLLRGGADEAPQPVQIAPVLQQLVQVHAGRLPQPRLASADNAVWVLAQPARLARVLGHLVQNAIEASGPDGEVTISMSGADRQARIDVVDRGHGMSAQFMRERLFKPFESSKESGMGIGLFETREYVQECGGKLKVSSTPGAGTTITVLLPRCAARETIGGQEEAVDH